MNVVFNRSLRFGKVTYHKSKVAVVLDDKLKSDWYFKAAMEAGDVSVLADMVPAPKAEKAEKSAK